MTTKPTTPDALRKEAEKLAEQAAKIQAQLDAHSLAEYEREQEAQRKTDQTFVDTFDADALDRNVETAHQKLRQTIAESPVVQAQAAYIAAQWIRNHAHADLMGARGRLGLPEATTHPAGTDDVDIRELTDTAVRLEATNLVDAHRKEQSR